MRTIFRLALFALCFSLQAIEKIDVKIFSTHEPTAKYSCEATVALAGGWKMAKKPTIVVKNDKVARVDYDDSGAPESIEENKYKIPFSVVLAEDVDNLKNIDKDGNLVVDVQIRCAMCSSSMCKLVSKDKRILIPRGMQVHLPNDSKILNFDFANPLPFDLGLITMICIAFIGGIILNFMPCVLPVIAMKIKILLLKKTKISLLGAIAGNYATFFAFALCVSMMKLMGHSVLWGMHFQSTIFLLIFTMIMYLMSLYCVELINFSPSITISGKKHGVFWGNFFSSAVASIMAIPCTAPFLGVATSFAIQGSNLQLFVIFCAIATGFSVPFIASLFIDISKISCMSRYSERIKSFMNILVICTFLWMLYMLLNHLSLLFQALVVTGFALSSLLFVKKHKLAGYVCLLCVACLVTFNNYRSNHENMQKDYVVTEGWKPLTERTLEDACKSGKVVLINITASWCATCYFNKINVLESNDVKSAIAKMNVECLEGNLTHENLFLVDFMKKYNRVGIPFNVVFGPSAKDGILLNEILTAKELIAALEQASK